ncbi:hypothetical protein KYJ26_20630 [Bacillus sp. MCCB 382]|uniref:hypothetical protein n=1 Tax=Bacillus sp. MCCB 382 TaxID=2860197 RepID=UPI001C58D2EC|nr:hypothetical protein [Bacillus sp. MCCB 382]
MKELVDYCAFCQKPLYCLDGFFNGVHLEGGKSCCFECEELETRGGEVNEP